MFTGMLQDAGLSLDDIDGIVGIVGAPTAAEWKLIAHRRLEALDAEIEPLQQGPGTTIQTIALARFTDKLSLVRLSPSLMPPVPTDPVDPDAFRIDHRLEVVVIGSRHPPLEGGPVSAQPTYTGENETVVAEYEPVSGRLLAFRWAPEALTRAVVTP